MIRQLEQISDRDHNILGVGSANVFAHDFELWTQIFVSAPAEFAVSAANSRIDHDTISNVPAHDALAKFVDVARRVRAWNVRQGEFDAGPAVAHPDIEPVERCCPHANSHFTRAGFWHGEIADNFQCISRSMLFEQYGTHQRRSNSLRAITIRWISLVPS